MTKRLQCSETSRSRIVDEVLDVDEDEVEVVLKAVRRSSLLRDLLATVIEFPFKLTWSAFSAAEEEVVDDE